MQGISEEYLPKFKFFQFKKSQVKVLEDQEPKVMLTFTDIS